MGITFITWGNYEKIYTVTSYLMLKTKYFTVRSVSKQQCSFLQLLVNIEMEELARTIGKNRKRL